MTEPLMTRNAALEGAVQQTTQRATGSEPCFGLGKPKRSLLRGHLVDGRQARDPRAADNDVGTSALARGSRPPGVSINAIGPLLGATHRSLLPEAAPLDSRLRIAAASVSPLTTFCTLPKTQPLKAVGAALRLMSSETLYNE